MLQSWAQPKAFATIWRVKVPIEKKDLEFFFKIWVWGFLATHFGDPFASHEFIYRLSWLTRECKSQSQKRLREIFKNLGSRNFGDSLGNSSTSQLSNEKRVFCKNRVKNQTFFQNFSLPLASCACLFVFSTSPSLKTIFFTPKTSIFLFNFAPNPRKCMGFHSFLLYFKFKALYQGIISRFSNPDHSLNRKRNRFKVFEVELRSNRDDVIINLIMN